MSYFSGRVHSVVFSKPGDAFYILRLVLDESADGPAFQTTATMAMSSHDPTVTARGVVQGIPVNIGTWFGFEAEWQTHPKWGKQLAITKAPVLKNGWDPDTAEKTLTANGVGSRVCAQIRTHFGDDEFLKALGSATRLAEVPGITDFVALHVAQRWESVQAHFRTLDFLEDMGLPRAKLRQVWATFQDDTIRILSKDPWSLVQVDGITFEQADGVARKLGLDMTNPSRIKGAVLFACKTQRGFGHVYYRTGLIVGAVQQMAGAVDKDAVAKALVECHKDKTIVLDRETKPGTMAVYEPWMHKLEKASAEMLLRRLVTARVEATPGPYLHALQSVGPETEKAVLGGFLLPEVIGVAVEEWGSQAQLKLVPKQRQGIINALLHPISVLTGLPGTGKTTSLKAAVRIFQDARVPFLLCAPTGIAAKNLGVLTGARASTIHRAFSAKGFSTEKRETTYAGVVGDADLDASPVDDGQWGYGPENPYPAEVVIIDEASMLDQHLLYRLLSCTAPQCRLVFVGDHAQLPSVGPGNVLRNLIDSGMFPVIKLLDIFRQKDTSDIVHAAHAIHRGDVPATDPPSDFVLQPLSNEDAVLRAILDMAQDLYEKRVNFQILSPRHSGTVGVTNLNACLRELLNPAAPGLRETRLGNDVIREDDRIMVIKNNYSLGPSGIFNGDVGKISRIDDRAKEVEVKIFGDPPMKVSIPFSDLSSHIRLAYACTVHKAQGLEYNTIVMPIVDGFRQQLQRNLLYTAVTRAKEKVFLVGTRTALGMAVVNDKEDLRDTLLVERLRGQVLAPVGVIGV